MINVLFGDITQINVDVIVNAANASLFGGNGVDGAIHRVGGSSILEECLKIREKQGGCKVGEAVITTAGLLPAKYVIHTVGPVWKGGTNNEEELLANAYKNSIQLAAEYGLRTMAFPAISTGVYLFPKQRAAEIALSTVLSVLQQSNTVQEVTFVCFDQENYTIYSQLLESRKWDSFVEKYVEAQSTDYTNAFREIKNGKKESHWMWYIFPQIAGLGMSEMTQKYAIQSLEEAEFYLKHEVVGKRLLEICDALLEHKEKTAQEILGDIDSLKLKSSMTLFGAVKEAPPIFAEILAHFFDGKECLQTLDLIAAEK